MTTRVHGLTIRSDLAVGGHHEAVSSAADVRILDRRVCMIDDNPPPGRIVAEVRHDHESRRFSTVTVLDDATAWLRVHGVCDIEISPDRTTLFVDRDRDAPDGLAEVVLDGTAIALLLTLRGYLVLHASAVEWGGRALAFVGSSGMGKSTLAAQCCATGARLLADDVLRVEVDDCAPPLAYRGSNAVRLRPEAARLGARCGAPARNSADGRRVLTLPASQFDGVPIDAILVPARRDGARVGITWMQGSRKLLLLEQFPRLAGWRDLQTAGEQFAMRAALVERVRVGIVSAPPELFMEPNVADRILELVWDLACTGEASNRDVERAHSPATNAEACIANSSA